MGVDSDQSLDLLVQLLILVVTSHCRDEVTKLGKEREREKTRTRKI